MLCNKLFEVQRLFACVTHNLKCKHSRFTILSNEHEIGLKFIPIRKENEWFKNAKEYQEFSLTQSSVCINLILIHTSFRRENAIKENRLHWDSFACIAFLCTTLHSLHKYGRISKDLYVIVCLCVQCACICINVGWKNKRISIFL